MPRVGFQRLGRDCVKTAFSRLRPTLLRGEGSVGPCLISASHSADPTGRPVLSCRNNVEDRHSRLPRAAAGLQGSDRPHRWPKAPTPARARPVLTALPGRRTSGSSATWLRARAAISPTARQGLASKINRLPSDRHPKRTGVSPPVPSISPKNDVQTTGYPAGGAIPFILPFSKSPSCGVLRGLPSIIVFQIIVSRIPVSDAIMGFQCLFEPNGRNNSPQSQNVRFCFGCGPRHGAISRFQEHRSILVHFEHRLRNSPQIGSYIANYLPVSVMDFCIQR